MPNRVITNLIDESVELAVGGIGDADQVGAPILSMLAGAGEIVPAWWSFQRDAFLRNFWKEASHLSVMMYTAQSLLVGIPMRIEARNPDITSHVEEAEFLTDVLLNVSEFGDSLYAAKAKYVEDYLAADNGGFMEVIGDGDADGPIEGPPLAVRHLDSRHCWRTKDKTFPVVYHDPTDNKAYALHRSRVIFMSQMPSAAQEMNGVGFCAVSRSIQLAQHLYDIYIYKQEKLGSRPMSQVLVGSGFTGSTIMRAMQMADAAMSNQGLRRFSRVVGLGSTDTDASMEAIDLNSFDPFDEETSVTLAMFAMSAAFGIPIVEVWPVSSRAGNKESSLQESRQRGKLPAEFNAALELQIEQKYLPPYLRIVHDWRDDGQDQRQGVNRDIRARNRERDLGDGAINIRVSREMMIEAGDATREQFATMELDDGRLEDGRPVSVLFYSNDKAFKRLLDLGVPEPTNIRDNDIEDMLDRIEETRVGALQELAVSTSYRKRVRIQQALAALDWLETEYKTELSNMPALLAEANASADAAAGSDPTAEAAEQEQQQAEQQREREQEEQQASGPREPSEVREGRTNKATWLKQNEDLEEQIEELRRELQMALENEEDDDTIEELIALLFLGLFLTGTGMEPDALTNEDVEAIDEEVERFMSSLPKMRDRVDRIDLDPTLERVGNRGSNLYWQGSTKYGEPEELLVWEVGPTANHCGTCGGLDGEVKTRSEWFSSSLLPQSYNLDCTGRHCQCGLYPIDEADNG